MTYQLFSRWKQTTSYPDRLSFSCPVCCQGPEQSEYRFLLSNKEKPGDETAYEGMPAIHARPTETELVDWGKTESPRIEIDVESRRVNIWTYSLSSLRITEFLIRIY